MKSPLAIRLTILALIIAGLLAMIGRHHLPAHAPIPTGDQVRQLPAEIFSPIADPGSHRTPAKPEDTATPLPAGPPNWLDLTHLPPTTRQIVALLLLLPIGCLMTAICRSIIGLRTFGTLTPALLALSFVHTDWPTALMVLIPVCIIALGCRRLRLLIVPRLSIMVTLIVVLLAMGLSIMVSYGITPSPSAILLPLVILVITVERFTLAADEGGTRSSLKTLASTSLVALVCYLFLSSQTLGMLLLTYPEIHLFTIAALVAVGTYTGYRLSELWRFSDLARENDHA